MSKLQSIISGARPSGLYRFASRASAATVRRRLELEGWRVFYLDGREIDDKQSFLRSCATAMEFPDYFGKNWDALEECLNDLSWVEADGYVILFDHADTFELGAPRAWSTAMDILADAAKGWHDAGTPMFVLLRGSKAVLPTL
jgi:RNAse (barnase) inhibitor barstar